MRTAERKVQEVADRDRLLVQTALDIVEADGFHNLTLARLADHTAYSKGTVYNHFISREDLLTEMSAESVRVQLEYLQALADLPLTPARQMYAMSIAYLKHAETSPVLFECSMMARTESVRQGTSADRLRRRSELEGRLNHLVNDSVRQIVAAELYTGGLEPEVSLDVLRASLLGYSAMNVLSDGFSWAGTAGRSTRMTAVRELMTGLGWPTIEMRQLERVDVTVQRVVEEILRRHPQRGRAGAAS